MYIIRLPRLGQTMESGAITTWHLAEGDRFHTGDPLYEVETEKMNTEVEAKQDGVLARIVTVVGAEVPVNTVLAVIAEVDEEISPSAIEAALAHEAAPVDETQAGNEAAASATDRPARSDAGAQPAAGPVRAVPKARHLARQLNVDMSTVRGSGRDGVIRVGDVRAVAGDPEASQAGSPRVAERVPVKGVMKAMADSVSRSWHTIPQFVQQVSIDATALQARLKRLRYEGMRVTYTDLLIAAVASSAKEVPAVNATFAGDEIVRYADVNVSFAVASDRGLLVPVVRQAHELPIEEIGASTTELAGRAREGSLTAADASDGTITLSNLGAFGVETGTPLVNEPQAAIVFAGTLEDRAVAENGGVVVRPILNIATAYDHRVADGMVGAQFTSALKNRLEAGG